MPTRNFRRRVRGQQRLGLLEQGRLVGRAAALCDEEELVGFTVHRLDVDLGRQIGAGVDLPVHVERDGLRVAEILFRVGLVDPPGEGFLVPAPGPDLLAFLGDDQRRAGVLADREFEFGGDLGVAQERHGHALVVLGGLRVAQDPADGLVVLPAKQEGDVTHRLVGEDGQRFGSDLEDVLAFEGSDGDVLLRALHPPVPGLVRAEGVRILIDERFGGHWASSMIARRLGQRRLTRAGCRREPLRGSASCARCSKFAADSSSPLPTDSIRLRRRFIHLGHKAGSGSGPDLGA